MSNSNKLIYIPVEEYLRNEEVSPGKHEYVDGQIFAMTGSTRRHNIISGNIYSILRSHLKGSPCRAYMADIKARVEAANCFYYPDVMVSCDAFDSSSVFTDSPVLIIEVLSRSTATIDRREKLVNYRQIPTLNDYVIIHQRKKRIELYRKNEAGVWQVLNFESGEEFPLTSIPGGGLTVSVDEIYEGVEWTGSHGSSTEVREQAEHWLGEEDLEEEW